MKKEKVEKDRNKKRKTSARKDSENEGTWKQPGFTFYDLKQGEKKGKPGRGFKGGGWQKERGK